MELKELVWRKGEPTEAVCFQVEGKPRTEVAAQKCGTLWCIFYISSKALLTLRAGLSEEAAIAEARLVAKYILNHRNPRHAASEVLNQYELSV